MNICCDQPAPTPFRDFFAALAAALTPSSTRARSTADLEAEASAAHRRALARAAGTWGGYQAARPAPLTGNTSR